MAQVEALSTFSEVVEKARVAFSEDPSYAISMAQQAVLVRTRQASREPSLLAQAPSQRMPVDA